MNPARRGVLQKLSPAPKDAARSCRWLGGISGASLIIRRAEDEFDAGPSLLAMNAARSIALTITAANIVGQRTTSGSRNLTIAK